MSIYQIITEDLVFSLLNIIVNRLVYLLPFCMISRVSENMPLYDILNEFQKGHSHIAVVYKDLNESKDNQKKTKEGENLSLSIYV